MRIPAIEGGYDGVVSKIVVTEADIQLSGNNWVSEEVVWFGNIQEIKKVPEEVHYYDEDDTYFRFENRVRGSITFTEYPIDLKSESFKKNRLTLNFRDRQLRNQVYSIFHSTLNTWNKKFGEIKNWEEETLSKIAKIVAKQRENAKKDEELARIIHE